MCIVFGGEDTKLEKVAGTKIFVAPLANGRQLTLYENIVELDKASDGSAMILPVPAGMIEVLDLSGVRQSDGLPNSNIFEEMKRAYPELVYPTPDYQGFDYELRAPSYLSAEVLVVKSVGSYFVSVAPRLEDIQKIDPTTFKVPANIQKVLTKHYGGNKGQLFSFVICRFRTASVQAHPIGYIHERLLDSDGLLFCPTKHAHGNGTEESNSSGGRIWRKGSGEKSNSAILDDMAKAFQKWPTRGDWDHEIYSWGCERKIVSGTTRKVLDGGETPHERYIRLDEKIKSAGKYSRYHGAWIHDGSALGQSCKGVMELAKLWPVQAGETYCEGPASQPLRHREVSYKDEFPNEDLLFKANSDAFAAGGDGNLPAPAGLEQRANAVEEMAQHWIKVA